MNTITSCAVFFTIWWVALFAILPIGIRSQQEAGAVVPGTDPGAPIAPRFLRIVGLTTLVAIVVFALVYWLAARFA